MNEQKREGRLVEDDFGVAVRSTRLTPPSVEIAHQVLVDGKTQQSVAKQYGCSEPRVSKIVRTVLEAHRVRLAEEAKAIEVPVQEKAALVQADYDVMVMNIRKGLGNNVKIDIAQPAGRHTGLVVECTSFFVAQDVGRGAVTVHRLSQLDSIPAVGRNITIAYEGGKGVISARGDRSKQTSLGR